MAGETRSHSDFASFDVTMELTDAADEHGHAARLERQLELEVEVEVARRPALSLPPSLTSRVPSTP